MTLAFLFPPPLPSLFFHLSSSLSFLRSVRLCFSLSSPLSTVIEYRTASGTLILTTCTASIGCSYHPKVLNAPFHLQGKVTTTNTIKVKRHRLNMAKEESEYRIGEDLAKKHFKNHSLEGKDWYNFNNNERSKGKIAAGTNIKVDYWRKHIYKGPLYDIKKSPWNSSFPAVVLAWQKTIPGYPNGPPSGVQFKGKGKAKAKVAIVKIKMERSRKYK
jgi:hypothetical protein